MNRSAIEDFQVAKNIEKCREFKEKHLELQEEYLQLEKDHLQLEKDYGDARKQCGELKIKLVAAHGANDELRAVNAEKDIEMAEIRKQLSDSEKRANDFKDFLDKSQASLDKLQDEMNAKKLCRNLS